jgi:hypothetical protein
MLIKFVHDNIINTLVWASKMGRKFDPDAKRWRFRSSLIYALGNGLEVSTYLHPQYFLVLGMLFLSASFFCVLCSSKHSLTMYSCFQQCWQTAANK